MLSQLTLKVYMLTSDAISHFKTAKKMAECLECCTHQAIYQWGKYPPYLRQCEIELLTAGALKREPRKDKSSNQKRPCLHHPVNKVS